MVVKIVCEGCVCDGLGPHPQTQILGCGERSIMMASISPIVSEAGPGLEQILSLHGLKSTDLDKECPE